MNSFSKNFLLNFIWQVFGQLGYYIISLIGNIVLARYLGAYEFGVIGIMLFFITVTRVLTDSGLSGALIRKGNPTDEDYSTIFIFNLAISLFCYLFLFALSPYIADFYDNEKISTYLRVISLILIINAFQFTQSTRLVVNLQYKRITYFSMISVILSTVIGIILSILNYGVWSLIGMQISNALILTIIYWIKEGGYSKIVFNKTSFSSMYKFGMFTTMSSLLNTAFENSYQLILGKYFSINITGYYFQGKKLQEIPVGIIKNATTGVVFSTLSKVGDDQKKFSKTYTSITILFTAIVGLICLNLYVFSEDIVVVLYGKKWIESTFYIKVLSVASFFYMQEMLNRNIFKVFDRTDRIFKLELIKKGIQLISIIIGVYFLDIKILMYGFVVVSAISFIINYLESRKIFTNAEGTLLEFYVTVKIFLIFIVIALIGNHFFYKVDWLPITRLLIFIPVTTFIYVLLLHMLKIITVQTVRSTLTQFKK